MTTRTEKVSLDLEAIIPSPAPRWVMCPICAIEWTRLYQCSYRLPMGYRSVASICINCSLDARQLSEINLQICKIENVSIEVKRLSYGYEVAPEHLNKSMFYALVEMGGIRFHLSMSSSGQKLQIKHSMDESRPLFSDNNIAALFLMNSIAMNPLEFEKLNGNTEISGRTPAKKFW